MDVRHCPGPAWNGKRRNKIDCPACWAGSAGVCSPNSKSTFNFQNFLWLLLLSLLAGSTNTRFLAPSAAGLISSIPTHHLQSLPSNLSFLLAAVPPSFLLICAT